MNDRESSVNRAAIFVGFCVNSDFKFAFAELQNVFDARQASRIVRRVASRLRVGSENEKQ
jgi:hypothetical protein